MKTMNVPEKRVFLLEVLRDHCDKQGKRYMRRLETNLSDINQRATGEECDRLADIMLADGVISEVPWRESEPESQPENPGPSASGQTAFDDAAQILETKPPITADDRRRMVHETLTEVRDVFEKSERHNIIIIIS